MTTQAADHTHPVVEFAHRLTTRLEDVARVPVWSLTPAEQRHTLVELARAEAQLAALRLRVLAEAERSGAGAVRAAASAADWVAIETRQTRISARADLNLAQALEQHAVLADRLRVGCGECGAGAGDRHRAGPAADQRRVRRRPTQRQAAEAHLVALAADHDAKALAVLGRKLFEVIAPDLAEAYEGQVLADQEAAAARRTMLTMREDADGHLPRPLPDPDPAGADAGQDDPRPVLPGPFHATDIDDSLPTEVRHGLALCQLIEAIPAKSLPKAGGCGATIVVTMHPRPAARRPAGGGGVRPGHRRADHRRPGPPAGVHRRDHPRRPRRPFPGPRPRPPTPALHRSPTDRPRDTGQGLHRRRLRPTTRPVPRPPRHRLVPGRAHRPTQRTAVVRPPPPPHPRPRLPTPTPTQRPVTFHRRT